MNFKLKKFGNKIADGLAEIFAPTEIRCLSCGADVFDDLGFCPYCLKEVNFNNGKICKRCGVGIDGDEDYCGNCAFDKVYFDKAYSAFNYDGAVQRAVLQMKFANCGRDAKVFARYLAFLVTKHNLTFDVVCYPPMSKSALKIRHYNQSQLLAKYLCDILNRSECLLDAFVKVKDTDRQETLNRSERKVNLIGAYKIKGDVKGKRVLVIDDVKTTGATLNECAKVLKKAGAESVVCLTVSSRKENVKYEKEID